jgi:hypothetical protein
MGDTRDYLDWHDDYERPGSSLHRRLQVVIRLVRRALHELPPGPVRVLSLCAGQGTDLLGAADGNPRAHDLVGRLVELDPRNVEAARLRIDELGLEDRLEVLEADASVSDVYAGAIPANLVLACGIFGNISEADIERTIRFLPSLCAPDAWVLWTRHARDSSVFDRVQGWFVDAGLEPIEVEVADDATYGVGANRLVVAPPPFEVGQQIFTFTR